MLAIPAKRFERNLVTFLTEHEANVLLAACDRTTWTGRRDHTMLVLAIQTGLRISELTALTISLQVTKPGRYLGPRLRHGLPRHAVIMPTLQP